MLANIAIVLTLVLIIQVVSIKKHLLHHKLQTDREGGGARQGFFTSKQHHFNKSNYDTFEMRIWVDDTHFDYDCNNKENGCAVFLMMGGEGTANAPGGHMVNLAEEFGALAVSIEHRFYGSSIIDNPNGGKFSNEHLTLLSVEQAMMDAARFISSFSTEHPSYKLEEPDTGRTKWITFGGSYSGELSAWMRVKFPSIVYGAVASSAPISAIADYWGYDIIILDALKNELVGGSEACGAAVVAAFKTLADLLENNVKQVISDFAICEDTLDDMDKRELLDFVSDDFMGVVQYNNVNDEEKSIAVTCKHMIQSDTTPYDNLVTLTNARNTQDCLSVSYNETLAETCAEDYAGRAWLFQMCADGSGHDQTCVESEGCPFIEKYATYEMFLQFCHDCFGVGGDDVSNTGATVEDALLENYINFGGNNTRGFPSNIIFVNGNSDPFSWGGVNANSTAALEKDVVAFVADGGSHCQDMNALSDNDTESMKQVKEGKRLFLKKFLAKK